MHSGFLKPCLKVVRSTLLSVSWANRAAASPHQTQRSIPGWLVVSGEGQIRFSQTYSLSLAQIRASVCPVEVMLPCLPFQGSLFRMVCVLENRVLENRVLENRVLENRLLTFALFVSPFPQVTSHRKATRRRGQNSSELICLSLQVNFSVLPTAWPPSAATGELISARRTVRPGS